MTEKVLNLANRVIAVPESRQLDIMAQLFETRGAKVMRVPLVAIHDAPDSEKVLSWIRAFVSNPPELFIVFTGEGLRRLLALADRNGLREAFVNSLGLVKKLCRGPKPVRVLRQEGLTCEISAIEPTTDGVIASLEELILEGVRVSVQLYGEDPNLKLINYLDSHHAQFETVAPYIYADQAEEGKVIELIHALDRGELDVIAFTSQPQFKRLVQVAKSNNLYDCLLSSFLGVKVAAIGPLVKEQLEAAGIRVDIMPERAFFMKPLVTAIMKNLST